MRHEIELTLNEGGRVNRYPWPLLAAPGDEVILYGVGLQAVTARDMIYRYAHRRGWKVTTRILSNPRRLMVFRES